MQISRNIRLACLVLGTFALLPFATFAQDSTTSAADNESTDSNSKKVSDQAFLKEAADGGLAEVDLGQLAMEKASSPEVKEFAQRMVTDHGKANDQLKEIATRKGVTISSEPNAKDKATKDRLAKLSGEEFDKAYMAHMLKDHKKDVAAFKSESTNGQDPDIKQFASETLPTLEEHLKQAESVTPKVAQH